MLLTRISGGKLLIWCMNPQQKSYRVALGAKSGEKNPKAKGGRREAATLFFCPISMRWWYQSHAEAIFGERIHRYAQAPSPLRLGGRDQLMLILVTATISSRPALLEAALKLLRRRSRRRKP